MPEGREPSSFRDPAGFLFREGGVLYRQVNEAGKDDYEGLMSSGLYDALVKRGLLVPHEESASREGAHRILKPQEIPFVSYPYEWSFSQLRDAAFATLSAQKEAFAKGMTLKDATAYNIQFLGAKPVLIDTLSFEPYVEGRPWIAYRQFCQHFLAPLALMAKTDLRLGDMLRTHLDGIPLDLASRLLPARTRLQKGLLMHIHLHAMSQVRHADAGVSRSDVRVGKEAFQGLIESLVNAVHALSIHKTETEWGNYYAETNYSDAAFGKKHGLVERFLDRIGPKTVWDLGANDGTFSRLASSQGRMTVAMDIDANAVERNYLIARKENDARLLPLLMDLTNPSPALGWAHQERMSLMERGPADCAMALALVHHLAISNNLPLPMLAETFSRMANHLIVEFVPKSDSQVKRLLASREDIFPDYTKSGFEKAFRERFEILASEPVEGSERTLYLMRGR